MSGTPTSLHLIGDFSRSASYINARRSAGFMCIELHDARRGATVKVFLDDLTLRQLMDEAASIATRAEVAS